MQHAFPIGMVGKHSGSVAPPVLGQIVLGGRTNYGNTGNAENTLIAGWGGNPTYSVLLEYFNTAASWGPWNTGPVWDAVGGWAPGFTTWPGPKCVAIPLQVTNTPRLWTDVTGGGQDSAFTSCFEYLYSIGCQYIRMGWEPNNPYNATGAYPWACGPGGSAADISANQTGYSGAVTHVRNIAQGLYPGYFKFLFNVSGIQFPSGPNFVPGGPYDWGADGYLLDVYNTYYGGSTWPGDAAMLTYLESGNQPNWNTVLSYCQANNKIIGFGELGPENGTPGPTPVDDPTFWSNMFNLCVTAASVSDLQAWYFPWNNGGNTNSDAVSYYPNSMATITSLVGTAVADGLIKGNPTTGQVVRSTASQFPLSNAAYPGATTAISGIALGPQGDLILVPILVTGGGTAATVTASSPANSIEFRRVNVPYVDASWPGGTAETELWMGVVTAAAAYATGVTITVTFTGTDTYTLITVDALTSQVGAYTNWANTTFTGNTNATSTNLDYLSVTAPSSTSPLAYYGYLQLSGATATGGTNPINAQTFTYTGTTTSTGQIAFCGNIQSASTYAPVGTASVSTPTFGFGQIWTAKTGTAPQLALSQPLAQTGTDGTPISGFSVTAAGGSGSNTFSIANQPTGITINTATGAVSGTPSAVQTLTTSITVTDGSGQSVTVYFPFVTTSSSHPVPNAPTTINGVTVPTTIVFDDEFTGPHLDTTKWLPGYFKDNVSANGAFGTCNTISESNISFGEDGGLELYQNTNSVSAICTMPWSNQGPWTANSELGITNPITDFTGFSISPNGGGVGSGSGAYYVEVKGTPTAAGGGVANWMAFWLIANDTGSIDYTNYVVEIDIVETGVDTTYGSAAHVHFGPNGGYTSSDYYWDNRTEAGTGTAVGGEAHTYGVMVTADWIAFVLDGEVNPNTGAGFGAGLVNNGNPDTWIVQLGAGSVMNVSDSAYFSGSYELVPMGIILTNTNHCGGNNSFPSTVPVEYCRVFQG